MIAVGEDLLICDFAETYHIYDYRSLPVRYAAIYAAGLRSNSRIVQKLTDTKCGDNEFLLALICDEIRAWHYSMTEAAETGVNKPQSIIELFTNKMENKKEVCSYDSGEAFDEAWRNIVNGNNS